MTALIVLQNCRTLQLTRGKNTLVDEEDLVKLGRWKWHARCVRKSIYAWRRVHVAMVDGKQILRNEALHRLVLGVADGFYVDHRDGDGLNNTKANLRICTRLQNSRNRRNLNGGASRFKGVARNRKRWDARIEVSGKRHRLGGFATEEEAALAYDAAAIRLHGEFACTNAMIFGEYCPATPSSP